MCMHIYVYVFIYTYTSVYSYTYMHSPIFHLKRPIFSQKSPTSAKRTQSSLKRTPRAPHFSKRAQALYLPQKALRPLKRAHKPTNTNKDSQQAEVSRVKIRNDKRALDFIKKSPRINQKSLTFYQKSDQRCL